MDAIDKRVVVTLSALATIVLVLWPYRQRMLSKMPVNDDLRMQSDWANLGKDIRVSMDNHVQR